MSENMSEKRLKILHVCASARPGRSDRQAQGSHTRQLTGYFLDQWLKRRPQDQIIERDVGLNPPRPVSLNWIRGVFSNPADHDDEIRAALVESDELAAELVAADVVVVGAPMYNFGMPAQLKAWIDNVVRIGITFRVDVDDIGSGAKPLLDPAKRMIIFTARGDHDEEHPGGESLVVAGLRRPMTYIGLTRIDTISIHCGLFHDDRMERSLQAARARAEELVREIQDVD